MIMFRPRATMGGLGFALAVAIGSAACDSETRCPPGHVYDERIKACYEPRCPPGSILDMSRNTCRAPCPPGYAFHEDRHICYLCPDASIGEYGEESHCDPPAEDESDSGPGDS